MNRMGVITAQLLILILGVALTLGLGVLIRRAMHRFTERQPADIVLHGSRNFFAVLVQTNFRLAPSNVARVPAPPRAPPGFLLRTRHRLPAG